MATQISDPSVVVNNVGVAIVPNSLEFTEGLGEQEILVQAAGGGVIQWFLAEYIPRQQQRLVVFIPERHGEHPITVTQRFRAIPRQHPEEHFGIAGREKYFSLPLHFSAFFFGIV